MDMNKHPLQNLGVVLSMGVTAIFCLVIVFAPELFINVFAFFKGSFLYCCYGWIIAGVLFTIGNLLKWKNRP